MVSSQIVKQAVGDGESSSTRGLCECCSTTGAKSRSPPTDTCLRQELDIDRNFGSLGRVPVVIQVDGRNTVFAGGHQYTVSFAAQMLKK